MQKTGYIAHKSLTTPIRCVIVIPSIAGIRHAALGGSVADMMFVGERREKKIRFSSEPVLNALCSLCLLNQGHLDNISSWVDATKQHLSDEERTQAELACQAVPYVNGSGQDSFEGWANALRARQPEEFLQIKATRLRQKALLELDPATVPGEATIMGNRAAFVDLVERVYAAHDESSMFDREEEERLFDELSGGPVFRDKLVAAIEHLWDHYLKAEWPRVRGAIETSVRAFRSIDIPGETLEEQVTFVTERDSIPEPWLATLRAAREVVFIPSVHIGPFMILLDFDGTTAYIAGHARIPEGSEIPAAEFNRSELLIRLDALSDETRLRMLELAATRGTVTTQDAMDALELSQSSASRHLTQLTATGLLSVDASERTKKYQLNAKRIVEVCEGIQNLLGTTVGV